MNSFSDNLNLNPSEGQVKCDGCNVPFYVRSMQNNGDTPRIKYACDSCLEDGVVRRCCKCRDFVGRNCGGCRCDDCE